MSVKCCGEGTKSPAAILSEWVCRAESQTLVIAYQRRFRSQARDFSGAPHGELCLRRLPKRVPGAGLSEAPFDTPRVEPCFPPAPLAEIGSRWPFLRALPSQARAHGYRQREERVRPPCFFGRVRAVPSLRTRTAPNPCQAFRRASQPPTPSQGVGELAVVLLPWRTRVARRVRAGFWRGRGVLRGGRERG